jgi:hypothetical protein
MEATPLLFEVAKPLAVHEDLLEVPPAMLGQSFNIEFVIVGPGHNAVNLGFPQMGHNLPFPFPQFGARNGAIVQAMA